MRLNELFELIFLVIWDVLWNEDATTMHVQPKGRLGFSLSLLYWGFSQIQFAVTDMATTSLMLRCSSRLADVPQSYRVACMMMMYYTTVASVSPRVFVLMDGHHHHQTAVSHKNASARRKLQFVRAAACVAPKIVLVLYVPYGTRTLV